MTVLVTRPEQQGQELCQQLSSMGIDAIHHPLLHFVPGEGSFSFSAVSHPIDIVIAVSQHAVVFCEQLLRQTNQSWPSSTRYLAIGQKTAQLLSKVTQQTVHYPQVSDSEHLLQDSQLASVSGLNIIILRGNGGRELIAQQLRERGADVIYWDVYHRQWCSFDAHVTIPIWQVKQVDRLVITSGEQLEFFTSQIPTRYRSWLFELLLYVPSNRIAQLARMIGFKNTITVGSASNSDLVAVLQPRNDRKTQ